MPSTSDYLFHYCGAAALLSIVTTRKLWASDIAYLNDRFEGEVLNRMLRDMVDHKAVLLGAESFISDRYVDVLNRTLRIGKRHKVACFSEHAMSLPMFRMYAPAAGGYAIGFLPATLASVGVLHKCSYSNDDLVSWCRRYIADFVQAAGRLDVADMPAQDLANRIDQDTNLVDERIAASIRFKSSDFANEAEVRLVPHRVEDRYRSSKEGHAIIPYSPVELPNDQVPVMLVPGPNRDPQLANDTMGIAPMAARTSGVKLQFQLGYWQQHAFRA